jgi:peptidoglycan/LPS O-acetylase OafA/YrhL
MKPSRLDAIDAGRGLAALSVFVYHYGVGAALARITGLPGFQQLAWPGANLAVPVFFVISGFCIHYGSLLRQPAGSNVRRFYLHRFFRIYPPWLVAIAVSIIALRANGEFPSMRQVLTHLTLTNGFFDDYRFNVALWSVSVEAFLYLVYPVWLYVRQRHGLGKAVAFAFGVSEISAIVTTYVHPEPTGPAIWFFVTVWCGWVSGAALAELWFGPRRRMFYLWQWWAAGVLGVSLHAGLVIAGVYAAGLGAFVRLPVLITLCVWPVTGLLLIGEKLQARPLPGLSMAWDILVRVGLFSYSLYLLHIPLIQLRFPVDAYLGARPLVHYLVMAGWFWVVLAISWSCWRWIELPSARLGSRLRTRPSAAAVP